MLSLPVHPAQRPIHLLKTVSPAEAAGLIDDDSTVAVEHLGDPLAAAIVRSFRGRSRPSGLTLVYATPRLAGRENGLNRLAVEGLVRRVIGGQWYPVPALQKLALAGRIEAYSLPAGVILALMRSMAAGLPAYATRAGLGSFTDPRNGGGRLNRRTRVPIVHLTRAPMPEALVFPAIPPDVGLVEVGFRTDTAALVMSREAEVLAEATHRRGGMVIGQVIQPGTIGRLKRGQTEVAQTLVDYLVAGEEAAEPHFPRERPHEG